jgi:hypothetical protein
VLASILQLIGQVKQIQLDSRVENDMNILLKQADSSLGEQFINNLGSTIIEGGLAETTATLRSGGVKVGDRNEQVLCYSALHIKAHQPFLVDISEFNVLHQRYPRGCPK